MPLHNGRTPTEVRRDLINEPYALGSYPRYAITDCGSSLCVLCLSNEGVRVYKSRPHDGFHLIHAVINFESRIECDHCGREIPSKYEPSDDEDELVLSSIDWRAA